MTTTLKCPNPSCPYLFDPSTVPPGVVLACPRCGMRFTLGTPGAPPPGATGDPATTPGYQQPTGYPTAPPQPAVNPAFADMTPETARADNEEGPRLPVRESRLQTFLLVGVAAFALAGAAVAVWYKVTHKPEELPPGLASEFKELNFSFEPPPSPWKRDEDLRVKLGSPYKLVYRRDNPEAFMAFGARDFETREPRLSELDAGLNQALDGMVEPKTLKVSDPPGNTWMGQEARAFKFRGQLKGGQVVEGEAFAVAHKGVGYWFLAWTGENEIYTEQKSAFADGRKRVKLLDRRKDWTPKQSNVVSFKGETTPYTILDADGVWRDVTDEEQLKAEDPNADKMLVLKFGKKKDIQQVAHVVVFVLPAAAGDPLTEGRQFVTEKRAAEVRVAGDSYMVEFKERTGPPEGEPTGNTVAATSPVVRLQSTVENAAGQSRLHVISAAKAGEKLVVVHAWCDLADRAEFEAMLVQLAGSMRTGG
jgi:hypothetical protein